MPALYEELVVSIQLAGHGDDPVSGHLAPALLAAPGFVVVPDPPDRLLNPHLALDALIVPTPVTVAARIERIPVTAVQELTRDGGGTTLLVLGLAHDSRYEPGIQMHEEGAVAQALSDGDVWSALERVGAVRPGLGLLTPAALMPLVAEVEQLQLRPRWGGSPVAISLWCLITRRCMEPEPHRPGPGPDLPEPGPLGPGGPG